jgi:TPR repeat protein
LRKDLQQAGLWYRKAADQGNNWALYNLGVCYEFGTCAVADDAKALSLFQAAAKQGNAWAETNIGWMYQMGRGVPPDRGLAIAWYEQAASHGDDLARKNLLNFRIPPPAQVATSGGSMAPGGDGGALAFGSQCSARGGVGSDSYCYKDGKQIDAATGEALESNDPSYVNVESAESSGESEGGGEESGGGYEGGGYEGGGDVGGGYEGGGDAGGGDAGGGGED